MSCQSGDIDADRGRWLENRMYFHYSKRWAREDLAVCQRSKFTAYISSKSFIVSGLIFKSLIHFEFIFVYGVRKCSKFIIFCYSIFVN